MTELPPAALLWDAAPGQVRDEMGARLERGERPCCAAGQEGQGRLAQQSLISVVAQQHPIM